MWVHIVWDISNNIIIIVCIPCGDHGGNSELGLTNLPSLHHHLDKKNYPTDLRIFPFFFLEKYLLAKTVLGT